MAGAARVLDTSAALALVWNEPGAETVAKSLPAAVMTMVNVSEFLAILMRRGASEVEAVRAFQRLGISVREFGFEDAVAAARLHASHLKLSLGDRACLAAAAALNAVAVTADRNWRVTGLPVEIEFIR